MARRQRRNRPPMRHGGPEVPTRESDPTLFGPLSGRQRRQAMGTLIALRGLPSGGGADDLSDLSGGANVAAADRAARRVRRSRETARSSRRGRSGRRARNLVQALAGRAPNRNRRSRPDRDERNEDRNRQAFRNNAYASALQFIRGEGSRQASRQELRRRARLRRSDRSRQREEKPTHTARAQRYRTKPLDYEVELRMSGPDITRGEARRLMQPVYRRSRGRIKGPLRYRRTVTRS